MTKTQFNALHPRDKKIAIAKDVIASLSEKRYKATEGTYLSVKLKQDSKSKNISASDSFQKVLKNNVSSCTVCALGALFTSSVRIKNDFKVDHLTNELRDERHLMSSAKIVEHLTGTFNYLELIEIEIAFELDDINNNLYEMFDSLKGGNVSSDYIDMLYETRVKALADFGARYKNPKNRMQAIMKNIVANDGDFIP